MSKTSPRNIKGILSVSQRGTGHLKVEGEKLDLMIDEEDLGGAFHGDSVEVLIDQKKNTGKVIKIISRLKDGFSGILKKERTKFILVPDDIKMYTNIEIKEKDLNGAKVGQKIYVEVVSWANTKDL